MNLLLFAVLFVVSSFLSDLRFRRFGFPFVFLTLVPHSMPPGTEGTSYSALVSLMDYPSLVLDMIVWYVIASVVVYLINAGLRSHSFARSNRDRHR
jgi:hypothetical protein